LQPLNSYNQDLTRPTTFVDIRKQRALQDAAKPGSEPKKETTTVSLETGKLGLNEAGINASEDEQRTARTGRHSMRMLACYEEIVKENISLSHQGLMLDFLKSSIFRD
jgi:hypothetical protein